MRLHDPPDCPWGRCARRAVLALISISVFATGYSSATRQESVLVPEEVSCPDCEIRLEPEVVLGDPRGTGMLESDTTWLSRDSRGRYYVCSPEAPYFWVFDSDGTILQRVGREGQGPGEFHRITPLLIGEGDRIYAFDGRQRRMSTFTSDYEFVGTAPFVLPVGRNAVSLGGRMVVNGMLRTSTSGQYPLHVVDRDGEIVRSFGSETGDYRPEQREFYELRTLGPAGDDGVWAAPVNQYLIERWSLEGQLTHVLRREVDWFQPWRVLDSSIDLPPDTLIDAVFQQGDILWVMVKIADPVWRTVVRPSGRFFTVLDRHKYVDTIIEAIDLNTGRAIASTRLDRALRGFVGEGMVYGQGRGDEGDESVAVFRFTIEG